MDVTPRKFTELILINMCTIFTVIPQINIEDILLSKILIKNAKGHKSVKIYGTNGGTNICNSNIGKYIVHKLCSICQPKL